MIAILQKFIDALRNELQQYGEMLALLDQQHEMVMHRGGEEIQQSVAAVNAHRSLIQTAREQRHQLQRQLAARLDQPDTATFAQIIPLLPQQYRPLVKALVQENNELLHRVEQRAQQNQMLLQHSLELMREFVASLANTDSGRSSRPIGNSSLSDQPGSLVPDALA